MANHLLSFRWKTEYIGFIIIGFFMIWKIILMIDFRYAGNGDGLWFLSQTFSLLRGDFFRASFGSSYIYPYLYPYMYAIITAPYFAFNPFPEISLQIYTWLWQIVAILLVFHLLKQKSHTTRSIVFILMSIITIPYYYSLRTEIPNISLLLLLLLILKTEKTYSVWHIINIALLSVFIGLIHPVGGVFAVTLTTLFFISRKKSLIHFGEYFGFLVLFICLLYGPVVLIDINAWWNSFFNPAVRQEHDPKIVTFLKFISQNPFLFLPIFIVVVRKIKNLKGIFLEVLTFSLVVGILALFGKSYYFPYLIVYIVWRLTELPVVNYSSLAVVFSILVFPLISHILPTFQQIENRNYIIQANINMKTVAEYSKLAESNFVWIPPYMGMPIINQPGSRAHHSCAIQKPITLVIGDVILVDKPSAKDCLVSEYITNPEQDLQITQIYPEVPGLLTLTSLFHGRSSPIGLWQISLMNPSN